MAQQSHKMVQGGPKLGEDRPNMTPKKLERYLEIIRNPRGNYMFASGVHVDTKIAENDAKLPPN